MICFLAQGIEVPVHVKPIFAEDVEISALEKP